MDTIFKKYISKLANHGVSQENEILIGIADDKIYWSQDSPYKELLEQIYQYYNYSAIILAPPAQPYKNIIDYLFLDYNEKNYIIPEDCESRTFLHKIPIVNEKNPERLAQLLSNHKGIIVNGLGVLTVASITIEQAFVNSSSIFFATFVNFFHDLINNIELFKNDNKRLTFANETINDYKKYLNQIPLNKLHPGPFNTSYDIIEAIIEAGKQTISYRLVDSYFGNISYHDTGKNIIYISQTGSSLDELRGHIDPCKTDNSSTVGMTASSEYSAHKEILLNNKAKTILHGHPKFTVIMSMYCDKRENCPNKHQCFRICSEKRYLESTPIIPGEIGTGKYGLCNSLPPAIKNNKGAIVYGHGLFTTGKIDFNDAFNNLVEIEKSAVNMFKHLFKKKYQQ